MKKGIPVKWTIKVKDSDLNGCNNPVTIPKYGVQKQLVPGDNVIEFTPREAGTIPYTCWMGMIRSTITVVDDGSEPAAAESAQAVAASAQAVAGVRVQQPNCCATQG